MSKPRSKQESAARWYLLNIVLPTGLLIALLCGAGLWVRHDNDRQQQAAYQQSLEVRFVEGYETYVIGTELTADAGIGFANSRCQFSFDNVRLAEAMFINASVDGPADVCSIATSIQWVEGEEFTPWKTSVGGDTLGPANDFTDHEPYPVAIAYRLRFTDGGDTGWGHNEEIILRREGGPDRMTEPRFVD